MCSHWKPRKTRHPRNPTIANPSHIQASRPSDPSHIPVPSQRFVNHKSNGVGHAANHFIANAHPGSSRANQTRISRGAFTVWIRLKHREESRFRRDVSSAAFLYREKLEDLDRREAKETRVNLWVPNGKLFCVFFLAHANCIKHSHLSCFSLWGWINQRTLG